MVKKEVRRAYIEKRNELSTSGINDLVAKIVDNFRSINLQGAQVLLSYHPIIERKEFDPASCADLLLLENSNLIIAWPKIDDDSITMNAVKVSNQSSLIPNRYNIPEPVNGENIDPLMIDVVFVPLLAFDTKGYRVGYGKGFYDRFLLRCSEDVVKIGFSYFEAIDTIDDVHEYDVPLNFCITPMRVYEF
jgi:5-formyltetrahydrofolate cyclo-ligase